VLCRACEDLIQIKDQSHLWARQYDREQKDLLSLQNEIAREIMDGIQPTIGGQRKASSTHGGSTTTSLKAYDRYLMGLYFWNKRTAEGFHQAADSFQQAIAKDPNYARAYAGLANTYALMSIWSQGPPAELVPKARRARSTRSSLTKPLPKHTLRWAWWHRVTITIGKPPRENSGERLIWIPATPPLINGLEEFSVVWR
jgi:hypothetical protein